MPGVSLIAKITLSKHLYSSSTCLKALATIVGSLLKAPQPYAPKNRVSTPLYCATPKIHLMRLIKTSISLQAIGA